MNVLFHVNMEMPRKCLMDSNTFCNPLKQSVCGETAGKLWHVLQWTALCSNKCNKNWTAFQGDLAHLKKELDLERDLWVESSVLTSEVARKLYKWENEKEVHAYELCSKGKCSPLCAEKSHVAPTDLDCMGKTRRVRRMWRSQTTLPSMTP